MSFSFLYSKIAETKMARSMLSHNGWLGDGKPIAKHWFAVA
jgi:hypothetical protein